MKGKGKAAYGVIVLAALAVMLVFVGTPLAADVADKVDINAASKAQLTTLSGVGDALADRIIEYRKDQGPFKSPEDIQNVKGIGPSIFNKNKGRIVVEKPQPVQETSESQESEPND